MNTARRSTARVTVLSGRSQGGSVACYQRCPRKDNRQLKSFDLVGGVAFFALRAAQAMEAETSPPSKQSGACSLLLDSTAGASSCKLKAKHLAGNSSAQESPPWPWLAVLYSITWGVRSGQGGDSGGLSGVQFLTTCNPK